MFIDANLVSLSAKEMEFGGAHTICKFRYTVNNKLIRKRYGFTLLHT